MILDTSALLAIVLMEPDAERYARAIAQSEVRLISTVSWFEATMRIDALGDMEASTRFDAFLHRYRIRTLPFTDGHAEEARRARRLYGKPHKAQLNYGDCMVYGVAKHEREPLLFKGADFAQTDIEPALKD